MNIRLFLEISKEFFNAMYSHFEEDEVVAVKEKPTREYQTIECPTIEQPTIEQDEEEDEEKGWSKYNDESDLCYCNGCNIYRRIILFIDPNIDDNKTD